MKRLLMTLPLLFALPACESLDTAFGANEMPAREVVVLGRTWTVTQEAPPEFEGGPATWSAIRDNNNLNPYGKPVARRTPQAIQALTQATGCQIVPGTLSQNTWAKYYAKMRC
ncbi:hypothetical protein [Pukyongiella litopenaei]|uniref:Lipoprotein n=1 Tax=Pukyongiella litopenaei TaxID=2605946 RepID=A0A2S0MSW9_9RHOB|nr:hypothetical protein [Pukyongiella litopenaei]AVO38980.1 hypothetical protein C6Y53_15535 [Pukyongiella litopenaei]